MKVDDLDGLTSATVLSGEGLPIGDLAAVHRDESAELLFVELDIGRPDVHVIVPAVHARIQGGLLTVAYRAADTFQGPTVHVGERLSIALINEILSYYAPLAPVEEPAETPVAEQPLDDPAKELNWPPIVKSLRPDVADLWQAEFRRPYGIEG